MAHAGPCFGSFCAASGGVQEAAKAIRHSSHASGIEVLRGITQKPSAPDFPAELEGNAAVVPEVVPK